MILLKEDALKEQKLADVTDKDRGEVTPVYADAIRQMKKTDKMRQEARKLPETPKTETPKVIKTEPLRKMHLSESLVEDYDDEITDVILVMYADGTEVDTFTNDREADALEDELNSMSEDELSEKDILGYARLMRDDEDKFLESSHYVIDDEHESKLNSEITYYINEFNGDIEESYESLSEAKKNIESAVYDELAKLWDGKDKLGKPKHIEVYSNPSANGYRIETANRSVIDEAEKIAKKYKLPYNSRQVRDYFVFTVDLPEEK